MYKRYLVIKEITDEGGKIPVGSEIDIVRDVIYLNGGMLDTYYQFYLKRFIENEEKNGFKYLRPQNPIQNKI